MKIKVLLIESAQDNGVSFAPALARKYDLRIAHSGKQGLSLAQEAHPDIVILDAVSLRTSGDRITTRLRLVLGSVPIVHIRPKESTPVSSAADVVLAPPFTARKLINRIEHFVTVPQQDILEAGPFVLNLEQQTLTTPWSEKKLTPKLVELMALFLRNAGTTLARKEIIQEIWKTEYMGDTRTLDVHIRWLRGVVEPDPRHPQYITTVRGVGYCLKLPEKPILPETVEKTEKPLDSTASESSPAGVSSPANKSPHKPSAAGQKPAKSPVL